VSLNSRLESNKEEEEGVPGAVNDGVDTLFARTVRELDATLVSGVGFRVYGVGFRV